METLSVNGLTSAFPGNMDPVTQQQQQQQRHLWRPWTGNEGKKCDIKKISSVFGDFPEGKCPKTLQITHPVKLYWPKSKCFDYLYQDAEMLLRNYPVQATICPYEDCSSEEDSEEEDEDEEDADMDKEMN